jgi:hypothetical protein
LQINKPKYDRSFMGALETVTCKYCCVFMMPAAKLLFCLMNGVLFVALSRDGNWSNR